MATLNAATWHGLAGLGAVAPAHRADLLVLPDLERFVPDVVLTAGRPPGEIAPAPVPEWVRHTVRIAPITLGDLRIPWQEGDIARVIGIVPGQIVTEALSEAPTVLAGAAVADPERDLAKIAVVERHLGTGRIGLGLVRGLGLRHGALATTIAHDAHNIVCVGVDDGDMARAVQRLAELGGGMVVVRDRGIRAELPLPVAGLLSDAPLERVLEQTAAVSAAALGLGTSLESPFHAIGFLSLSVIPELKITDRGLIDVGPLRDRAARRGRCRRERAPRPIRSCSRPPRPAARPPSTPRSRRSCRWRRRRRCRPGWQPRGLRRTPPGT